jgi:hypothetical protein
MLPKPKISYQLFQILIISFCTLISTSSHANLLDVFEDTYIPIGNAKSHFANPDRLWHNNAPMVALGFDSTENEFSNAWYMGIGKKTKWGAYELVYTDHGDTNSYALYPYDEGTGPVCVQYPCTPTQAVYHRGEARSLGFSGIREFRLLGDLKGNLRLGVAYYYASFHYSIANESGDPMARDFDSENGWSDKGFTPLYGGGLSYKALSVTFIRYHSISAKNESEHGKGSWQHIDQVGLQLNVKF